MRPFFRAKNGGKRRQEYPQAAEQRLLLFNKIGFSYPNTSQN